MFPEVNRSSFCALKRFCQYKKLMPTVKFLEGTWNRRALHKMMFITSTTNTTDLAKWLITPDLDKKIETINNTFNNFK